MEDKLNNILIGHKEKNGNIISLLQDIQEEFGYIPREVVIWFSKKLNIPGSRIYGIATFYAQFYLEPRGKNIITACCGTACHVRGSDRIISGIKRELCLAETQDTTPDREYTVEQVACLGFCSFAPVVLIDHDVRGKTTPDAVIKEIRSKRKK